MEPLKRTTYEQGDVTILLKDLTDEISEMSARDREIAISNGVHYSEMLPEEKEPSCEYDKLFNKSLKEKQLSIAVGIGIISEMIYHSVKRGKPPIIVSLARAGVPVGALIKRYLKHKYYLDCNHYAISIIRDKGIDINAMEYIYHKDIELAGNCVSNIYFIDGWTGKGVIKKQLEDAVQQLIEHDSKWKKLSSDLYVLADPANITKYCGTHSDWLLPSACLNSTITGLLSRTILNSRINENAGDFHGVCYFDKFKDIDYTNKFLDTVSSNFDNILSLAWEPHELRGKSGMDIVNNICKEFNIKDYKKVKPGVGETTRVLLRRLPWKVLINTNVKDGDEDIEHILLLCKEKNIPIVRHDLGNYKVCGIIKELSADA